MHPNNSSALQIAVVALFVSCAADKKGVKRKQEVNILGSLHLQPP